MRYRYTLAYQDYLDAQKLYRKHRWQAAASYYAFVWALPILGLIAALPLIAGLFRYHSEWAESIAPFSGVGIWVAICIPLSRMYSLGKCWKQILPENIKKSIKSQITVELEMTDEHLISTIPGKSEGRFFWPAILDFAEDRTLALLFVKKKLFLFVPHRAMDEAGWAEVRARYNSSRITP